MRWSEVCSAQPRFANLGEGLLGEPGVVLVVTTRRDGLPRLSPVEPLFWSGDLWLGMMLGSRKAADLVRDPAVLVHNIITDRDGRTGEYKVRGRAIQVEDPVVQKGYAERVSSTLGWSPELGRFHLFRLDIADISFVRYDPDTGDQYVVQWPRGREFVRRATSPTSLGAAEPHHEFLDVTRSSAPDGGSGG